SGAEHRQLVLTSALAGGVLLLWSDVLARSVMPYGAELPVGVITALLGGPFFCYLLRARSRREGL
ncbi:MAG: iron chelate uptake ABC transporter family permease subunit, partial [Desulfonatronovibrionaceae bacterium]